jgi:hypothetical protein
MSILNEFPDPNQLRSDLRRAGIPTSGRIGAALERYQLCLAKLIFANVSAQAAHQGLEVAPMAVTESPQQLRGMIEADSELLLQTIADNKSGLDR